MKIVALIPARAGSKRIPGKNIKALCGNPLLAYTIHAAIECGIFDDVYVSSDDFQTCLIAEKYGAKSIRRPASLSTDDSPDADWIDHAIVTAAKDSTWFGILRPTSPFRTADMIVEAWALYEEEIGAQYPLLWLKSLSLSVEKPEKMWRLAEMQNGSYANIVQNGSHIMPSNVLSKTYVQNGAIEFRATRSRHHVPSVVKGYVCEGVSGLDINTEADWVYAEWLVTTGKAKLPEVKR